MIGFCTDSNSQISDPLVERFDVEVVPFTVVVDGKAHLEGVDLDADAFYAAFGPAAPEVSTAAPSPGQLLAAYEALARRGATEIISVHIGSGLSATVAAANLAARSAPVPVRVVDTRTASFAVACALWEAAEAVAAGASSAEAAARAEAVAARSGNVFIVGALDLARAGGRLRGAVDGDGIPVLTLDAAGMRPIGHASTIDDAAEQMAAFVRGHGANLRVGIGIADWEAEPMWRALEDRLTGAPEVLEVVRYRIGPSVGAHTGPGTAGAVFYAAG